MESIGAMLEGDQWNNLNFNNEEADFMSQLMLGNCSLPNEFPITNISNCGLFSSSTYNSSEETSSEMYSFSQGNSTYSCGATNISSFLPFPLPHGPAGKYSPPMAYYNGMEAGDEFFNQDLSNDSTESSGPAAGGDDDVLEGKTLHQQEMQVEDNEYETSKKRPRIPIDVKNKRIVKPKMNQEKLNSSETNESSEDDSNGFHDELNGGSKEAKSALNLNGKTRPSRGSATDPQSLYARKRRERINERLRILQTLVPNGTKVDISTMLEEAVQYVKFLQLQIKLLSSDDMWMYSPIAYNGMDIGLRLEN